MRILLVEDDAEVRAVMLRFLDTLGCRTTPAGSAEQALQLLQSAGPYEVLLSDIALGAGMRGTQLAALAQRSMQLQATIQEGELTLSSEQGMAVVAPVLWK